MITRNVSRRKKKGSWILCVHQKGESNTPEVGVIHVFGVGGNKKNSSSSILRKWGWFDTLFTAKDYKVKKLTVMPKCQLSNQRHSKREEHWIVLSGSGTLNGVPLGKYEYIQKNAWHHLVNTGGEPLIIIETQIGECDEEAASAAEWIERAHGRRQRATRREREPSAA